MEVGKYHEKTVRYEKQLGAAMHHKGADMKAFPRLAFGLIHAAGAAIRLFSCTGMGQKSARSHQMCRAINRTMGRE
jgi:hypothetical protein